MGQERQPFQSPAAPTAAHATSGIQLAPRPAKGSACLVVRVVRNGREDQHRQEGEVGDLELSIAKGR